MYDDIMQIEFQIILNANDAKQEIQFRIDHWNEGKTAMSDIELHAEGKSWICSVNTIIFRFLLWLCSVGFLS
jgi:cellobiose-specific phosphotransferase system component IIA